ncbi:MAG: acetyl-CoA C-acyltransferase, partial [Longimicrobiales bacterium]
MAYEWIGRRVAIMDGCRTAFCKAGTSFRDLSPAELGTVAVRELIARAAIDPDDVDELVYGIVVPPVQAPNVAREVGLAAGITARASAFT